MSLLASNLGDQLSRYQSLCVEINQHIQNVKSLGANATSELSNSAYAKVVEDAKGEIALLERLMGVVAQLQGKAAGPEKRTGAEISNAHAKAPRLKNDKDASASRAKDDDFVSDDDDGPDDDSAMHVPRLQHQPVRTGATTTSRKNVHRDSDDSDDDDDLSLNDDESDEDESNDEDDLFKSVSSSQRKAADDPFLKALNSKARMDNLAPQLPLRPGRAVAFLLPPRKGQSHVPGEEEYILAKIHSVDEHDKTNYVVYDADNDASPRDSRFHTTIRSFFPLPDPQDRTRTYPDRTYMKKTSVLALYPKTTSFYKGTIVSGPIVSEGASKKRKQRFYNVLFENDDNKGLMVPLEYIVAV